MLRNQRRSACTAATAPTEAERRRAPTIEAHRPARTIDPELERHVHECIERRTGMPLRVPAPLVGLMLVSFAAEVEGELEAWTEPWFERFFAGWMASRTAFPEALAPHVVEVVGDIVEGLVEAQVLEARSLALIRDAARWANALGEALRRSRAHLA